MDFGEVKRGSKEVKRRLGEMEGGGGLKGGVGRGDHVGRGGVEGTIDSALLCESE